MPSPGISHEDDLKADAGCYGLAWLSRLRMSLFINLTIMNTLMATMRNSITVFKKAP